LSAAPLRGGHQRPAHLSAPFFIGPFAHEAKFATQRRANSPGEKDMGSALEYIVAACLPSAPVT